MNGRDITKIVRNLMLYKNKVNDSDLNNNEYELVRYLTKHKEGLSLVSLAEYLNVDKALVTRMVKKLKGLDYLEVSSDLIDKRKKLVKPKDKAFELKRVNEDDEIKYYNKLYSILTKEEADTLDILIDKIYQESRTLRKNKFKGL